MSLPVSIAFEVLGLDAGYTPAGGVSAPCKVLWTDEQSAASLAGFPGPGRNRTGKLLDVQAAEIASPKPGGMFVIGALTWRVVAEPYHPDDDVDDLIWRCGVERVTI